MSDIERELRAKLRRKQPPVGFDGRVMERVPECNASYRLGWKWIPAIAAAGLMIGIGVHWQGQRRADRAHEQLVQALQITAQKMALVERVALENLVREERQR